MKGKRDFDYLKAQNIKMIVKFVCLLFRASGRVREKMENSAENFAK